MNLESFFTLIREKLLSNGMLIILLMSIDLAAVKDFLLTSIPKCGTNLVAEILVQGTKKKRHNLFSYLPSVERLSRKGIYRGGFPVAHAFYRDDLYEALSKEGIAIIFVQRDPRDMVTSFARFMRTHEEYADMEPNKIPLNCMISDFILYPAKWMAPVSHRHYEKICRSAFNIKKLYKSYFDWTQKENVFVLRYEDLLGGKEGSLRKREQVLQNLFGFLDCEISDQEIKEIANSIGSMEVSTFTPGKKIGRWKQFFTEGHKQQFDMVADGLLELFGYEK